MASVVCCVISLLAAERYVSGNATSDHHVSSCPFQLFPRLLARPVPNPNSIPLPSVQFLTLIVTCFCWGTSSLPLSSSLRRHPMVQFTHIDHPAAHKYLLRLGVRISLNPKYSGHSFYLKLSGLNGPYVCQFTAPCQSRSIRVIGSC